MMECLPSLSGQVDVDDPTVLLAALPLGVAFFTRLFIDVVSDPTVMSSFAAIDDILPPSRPTASMMCISLFVRSLKSSVMIASSSSFVSRETDGPVSH